MPKRVRQGVLYYLVPCVLNDMASIELSEGRTVNHDHLLAVFREQLKDFTELTISPTCFTNKLCCMSFSTMVLDNLWRRWYTKKNNSL